MPPRFAYWTILIDNGATAFRAREAQDLLPTLHQLKRTNANVVMKWFSGGQLWDSPEAAQQARRRPPAVSAEKRGAAWRPGGAHADPRDRFRKKKSSDRFGKSPDRFGKKAPDRFRAKGPEKPARSFSSPRPPRRPGRPPNRGGPRRTR